MTENTAPSFNRLQVTDPDEMTWKNDQLDRKEYADKLTTLIKNTRGPYVIGLTSPWGSGKTFFLQAWRHQLLEEKKPCIYFNAWENDIFSDPLLNLMSTIYNEVETKKKGYTKVLSDWIKDKFKSVKPLIPSAIKLAGSLCGGESIPKEAVDAASNYAQTAIDYFTSRESFKESLKDVAVKISEESEGFPLFIMIDELDRCRPSYAIELLERIKHLFNVPHVVFLLAIDSTQLMQHVEHTFGLKPHKENNKILYDPRQNYLRKFFDIYYSLPPVENKNFIKLLLYNNNRLSLYSEVFKENKAIFIDLYDILTSDSLLFKGKSLRCIIQNIEYFSLFIRSYNDLTLEYIVFTFWVIFSTNSIEDILPNYGKIFENQINEYETNMSNILSKFTNKQYELFTIHITNDEFKKLKNPAYCAYIFIKICMISGTNVTIMDDFMKRLSYCYFNSKSFSERSMERFLFLKKATDIAKDVYERLQFLKDFHPVPQEQ